MEDIRKYIDGWLNLEFKLRRRLIAKYNRIVGTDVGTAVDNYILHVEDNIWFLVTLLEKLDYYEGKEEEENANKCTNN